MNTAMRWSILLVMIHAFGSCKEQDGTSSAPLSVAPCTLIVGQPSCIILQLSGDPKVDKKDLLVWKRANGTTTDDVPSKEDFIFEGIYKSGKKDLEFHVPVGYNYIWNSDKLILTIFIEEVGPQHEGAYVAEYLNRKFPFHLKVLAAPPSTQAPDTSTDGVKDSGAAAPPSTQASDTSTDGVKDSRTVDERFFTMHEEDRNAWIQVTQYLIAVMIVTVIASTSSVSFLGYLYFRKMSAAFKTKTGEEETSFLHSGGQDQTTGNASVMTLGYFNVQRRGNMNHRPGSGRPRLSDGTGGTEGRAGSFASGMQPDPGSDDPVIDMGTLGTARSSVPRGETRRGAGPRTRQSFN